MSRNKTVRRVISACALGRAVVYFGTTKRQLKQEDLRWLTTRGRKTATNYARGAKKYACNRPVLVWSSGSTITMGEARTKLAFKSEVIYDSSLHKNTTMVEEELQTMFAHFKRPTRLWRSVAKGASGNYDTQEGEYKVFITYSFKAPRMVSSGELAVQAGRKKD